MSLVVFNHHSLPFSDADAAAREAPVLVRTLSRARSFGLFTIRVSGELDPSWCTIELAPGYRWETWLRTDGEKPEHRELRTAFLSLATSTASPLLSDQGEEAQLGATRDCRLPGNSDGLAALHAAHCLDAPLASHATRFPWNQSPVVVEVDSLEEQGEVRTARGALMNLHCPSALEDHRAELLARRDRAFGEAVDLWLSRSELFPHLEFCPSVEHGLRPWPYGAAILGSVRHALTELDRFVADWRDARHSEYSHEALRRYLPRLSDESESVRSDPRLAGQRRFRLPSGEKRDFFFHVKLPQGFRIHYLPEGESKRLIIGYIGFHLRLPR